MLHGHFHGLDRKRPSGLAGEHLLGPQLGLSVQHRPLLPGQRGGLVQDGRRNLQRAEVVQQGRDAQLHQLPARQVEPAAQRDRIQGHVDPVVGVIGLRVLHRGQAQTEGLVLLQVLDQGLHPAPGQAQGEAGLAPLAFHDFAQHPDAQEVNPYSAGLGTHLIGPQSGRFQDDVDDPGLPQPGCRRLEGDGRSRFPSGQQDHETGQLLDRHTLGESRRGRPAGLQLAGQGLEDMLVGGVRSQPGPVEEEDSAVEAQDGATLGLDDEGQGSVKGTDLILQHAISRLVDLGGLENHVEAGQESANILLPSGFLVRAGHVTPLRPHPPSGPLRAPRGRHRRERI